VELHAAPQFAASSPRAGFGFGAPEPASAGGVGHVGGAPAGHASGGGGHTGH
jgi:hypothetical protein